MNATTIAAGAMGKLIAIRRETLAVLRQDVLRLNQLHGEAEGSLHKAQHAQTAFLEETRHAERGNATLFADRMQDRRRYLAHLETQAAEAQRVVDEIAQQQLKAQVAFETCHKEIRALERLAERRETASHQERQRRDYLRADDEQTIRGQRTREAHDNVS
jgi:hypothetical protein